MGDDPCSHRRLKGLTTFGSPHARMGFSPERVERPSGHWLGWGDGIAQARLGRRHDLMMQMLLRG